VPGDTQFIEVDCDSAIAAFKVTNKPPEKVRVPYPVYVQVDTSAILSEVIKTDAAKEEILLKRAEHAEHGLLAEVQRNNALQVRGDNALKWLRYAGSLCLLLLLLIAGGIYLYAKKFHITQNGTNISEEDLVGFANLILMEIIDDYVPFIEGKSELNNFSSFIRTWLEFNLHTELKKYGLAIKLPPNKITEISLQKKLISKYEQVNGESPRHGDQVDYCERGINKRAIFDVLNEKIEIYEKQENELVLIKSSKFDSLEVFEIKSGNEIINKDSDEVHLEVFDGIKSDPLIVLKTCIEQQSKFIIINEKR
jgi:hypothetical protein